MKSVQAYQNRIATMTATMSVRRRTIIIAFSLFTLIAGLWAFRVVPRWLIGIHQTAITQELAKWESEYSNIDSPADAIRTAEMLGYVQSYYPVADGYRGDVHTENSLESQREKTIDSFVSALKQFTGSDHGTDAQEWITEVSRTPSTMLDATSPKTNSR